MADYDFQGGGLKLKGLGSAGGKVAKKKKKPAAPALAGSSSGTPGTGAAARAGQEIQVTVNGVTTTVKPIPPPKKTAAELRFEAKQRERQMKRIVEHASKTHKDRVADYNAKLEKLPEHNDIPRIGPG